MSHERSVARLEQVAVGLARHGWHVRCAPPPDDCAALLVHARWSGDRRYRVSLDAGRLVLSRQGDPDDATAPAVPLGSAATPDDVHDLLRADVRGPRRARQPAA